MSNMRIASNGCQYLFAVYHELDSTWWLSPLRFLVSGREEETIRGQYISSNWYNELAKNHNIHYLVIETLSFKDTNCRHLVLKKKIRKALEKYKDFKDVSHYLSSIITEITHIFHFECSQKMQEDHLENKELGDSGKFHLCVNDMELLLTTHIQGVDNKPVVYISNPEFILH